MRVDTVERAEEGEDRLLDRVGVGCATEGGGCVDSDMRVLEISSSVRVWFKTKRRIMWRVCVDVNGRGTHHIEYTRRQPSPMSFNNDRILIQRLQLNLPAQRVNDPPRQYDIRPRQ